MKVPYQVRLVRAETHLEAASLGELLGTLSQGNLRALRLRIEGRSSFRGVPPQWLREAASFELVGIQAGSVVLMLEAPPLQEVLPPGLLGLLPPSFASKPCAALLAESLAAALSSEDDPLLCDDGLVDTFLSLSGIFASGVEAVELRFPFEEPWAQVDLRLVHIEKLRQLRRRLGTPSARLVELTGVLVSLDMDHRRYRLRTDDGATVNGFADDLLISGLAPLLGERVTVRGTAVPIDKNGATHLVTESIQQVAEAPLASASELEARGRLSRLTLLGFKTLRQLPDLRLGPLNVLIGANGAGKSNIVSFFKLLESLAEEDLVLHVARAGGADALLHDGASTTPELSAGLTFEIATGVIEYAFRLVSGSPDALIFAEERFRLSAPGAEEPWVTLGAGHRESGLLRSPDPVARAILGLLRRAVTYQFHNTSDTARIRRRWSVEDGLALKSDAANLAPFLLRLRESRRAAYDRIVETIRQITPFFADFHLEPSQGTMLLQWRERGTDIKFGPHQASDGMLRMMAIVALLLQPSEDLPSLLVVDEPELGLHPYAINIVAGLFRSASLHAQVILATQSTTFLDLLEPEEIIVVDRRDRESHLKHLDPEGLEHWLEDYSLGELWEKNVLGGRPGR